MIFRDVDKEHGSKLEAELGLYVTLLSHKLTVESEHLQKRQIHLL